MTFVRVHKHYIHIPFLILALVEFGLLAAAWFAGLKIHQLSGVISGSGLTAQVGNTVLFAIWLSCCTLAMGVYGSLNRDGFGNMILRTLVSYCLLGSIGLITLNFLFPSLQLKSTYYFWAILFAIFAVCIARVLFVLTVDTKSLQRRAVIWGAGTVAQNLLREFRQDNVSLGIDIVGCISATDAHQQLSNLPVWDEPEDWLDFCKKNHIHEILIAPDDRRRHSTNTFPLDQLLLCKLKGIEVIEALNFYERHFNKIKLALLKPSWMLFSDGFTNSKTRAATKRATDLIIALVLLILVSPLLVLTAAAVFLETGRPILYSQTRVGRNGKQFRMYKFRSMVKNAEQAGKAQWAQKNDSRITKVGNVIRNTRLDELPQLYNVITGDMSFVGPRPERPEFVEDLEKNIPFYSTRHQVKPGLMGWAQLKYPYGASEEDAHNKLEYDLYYTKNHSFFMDVLIMIQTVEVILLGKGVH